MTRYAKTRDGLHIAYQVTGNGPIDLLFNVGLISHVEAAWERTEDMRTALDAVGSERAALVGISEGGPRRD
jgi:hypothetical protein